MAHNAGRFGFDGDVTGYLGTRVLALLLTVLTLGFGFPYAVVLVQRWKGTEMDPPPEFWTLNPLQCEKRPLDSSKFP